MHDNFFYGLSMLSKYREVKRGRWYLIATLTDETFSLTSTFDDNAPENAGVSRHGYYFLLSAMNHSYWIIGCVLGALIGGMTSFNTAGVEFAMTALFVTIFIDQWMSGQNRGFAVFSTVLSVVLLLILHDNFVIPTMIILTIVSAFQKTGEKQNNVHKSVRDDIRSVSTDDKGGKDDNE